MIRIQTQSHECVTHDEATRLAKNAKGDEKKLPQEVQTHKILCAPCQSKIGAALHDEARKQ